MNLLRAAVIKTQTASYNELLIMKAGLAGTPITEQRWRNRSHGLSLETLLQDLRFASRMLRRNPAFTGLVVATLTLGIGANTALFSLINAVLVHPLPFQDPDRLVWITNTELSGAGTPGMTRSVTLRDWRELNHSFETLGCYIAWFGRQQNTITVNGETSRVEGAWVDKDFLKVLGVSPRMGRNFLEEDGRDSAILTDAFWRHRFQSNPAIIGTSITISGRPWAVVGILPASFDFTSIFIPGTQVDFLRPSPAFGDQSDNTHAVIGRLKPGITLQHAQAELDGLNQQLRSAHPERGGFGGRLIPLREHVSGQFRLPFLALGCAVGCILLIACVNVSSLLLARAAGRRKEMAVRMALGASRWRIVRQMLTESLILAGCGAALGLPLAYLATTSLSRADAFGIPLLPSARVDISALGFSLLLACSTGLLFGIVPALRFSNQQTQPDLKEVSRGTSEGPCRTSMREALLICEIALACMLLVGTGLLLRSFVRLLDVDLGFRPEHVAACRIRTNREFTTNTQEAAYFQELSHRIEALPGVESVGFTRTIPFALREVVHVHAQDEACRPDEIPSAFLQGGDSGYFKTLQIPLLAGRDFDSHGTAFDPSQRSDAVPEVIINEKLARTHWPGRDAVGQMLLMQENGNVSSPSTACKVIGVVGNVRQSPLEPEAAPQLYLQGVGGALVVRTKGSLAPLISAVRATLNQIEPGIFRGEFKPLSAMIDQVIAPKRLIVLLASMFSLLAVLLASVGIYGVIAYSVSQRTCEIGIRLALGCPTTEILRLIIQKGLVLALAGATIGLLASLAMTRLIQALLFRVAFTDPLTFLASGLLLLAVALLACWIPARRAAKLDPMMALRHE